MPLVCSHCQLETQKVIYLAMPGHFCRECESIFGLAALMPFIPTVDDDLEVYMKVTAYKGSYWKALWNWFFNPDELDAIYLQ